MNISSTTTQENCTTDRDACIIEMLEALGGMIRNLSVRYNLEFDDCYQHASLLMLETWAKMPDGCNVRAYLNGTVRRGLYQLFNRTFEHSVDTVSLNSPLDDDRTYLDILSSREPGRTEAELQHVEKVAEAVHSALKECRLDEQEYAVERYELTDYTPVAPEYHPYADFPLWKKGGNQRRPDNLRRSIKMIFDKHPQVQKLIQRETCVL